MDKYDEMIAALQEQQRKIDKTVEALREAQAEEKMQIPICKNCEHFHPHFYISTDCTRGYNFRFGKMHLGHCSYPRCKDRKETDSCQHYKARVERCFDKYNNFFCDFVQE